MSKEIPTKVINLPQTNREVRIYEWLTQAEDDEYTAILFGDNPLEVAVDTGDSEGKAPKETTMKVSMRDLKRAKNYLRTVLLVDMTVEEFDILPPGDREIISDALDDVKEKKGSITETGSSGLNSVSTTGE